MAEQVVHEAPYPAKSNKVVGLVNGVSTEAEVTYFSDKILVLVSQGGRLAQWIQVPLSAPSAASVDAALPPGFRGGAASLLPATHLTPRTLFGAGSEARETFGQLVAAQVGSLLGLRDAADQRTLLLGLGLDPGVDVGQGHHAGAGAGAAPNTDDSGGQGQAQTVYFDIVDLVQKAL